MYHEHNPMAIKIHRKEHKLTINSSSYLNTEEVFNPAIPYTNSSGMLTAESQAKARKKLPFGFLVQQEKKELQKVGSNRLRPDSAKVELGVRLKGFAHEI